MIVSFPWGAYLGEDSQTLGITTKISSWERVGPNVIPHVAKATGIYLNSMLATMEARRGGYDEAIMLSHDGYVADGPGENIFLVKDGVVIYKLTGGQPSIAQHETETTPLGPVQSFGRQVLGF